MKYIPGFARNPWRFHRSVYLGRATIRFENRCRPRDAIAKYVAVERFAKPSAPFRARKYVLSWNSLRLVIDISNTNRENSQKYKRYRFYGWLGRENVRWIYFTTWQTLRGRNARLWAMFSRANIAAPFFRNHQDRSRTFMKSKFEIFRILRSNPDEFDAAGNIVKDQKLLAFAPWRSLNSIDKLFHLWQRGEKRVEKKWAWHRFDR